MHKIKACGQIHGLPSLRMSGVIPPLQTYSFMAITRTTLTSPSLIVQTHLSDMQWRLKCCCVHVTLETYFTYVIFLSLPLRARYYIWNTASAFLMSYACRAVRLAVDCGSLFNLKYLCYFNMRSKIGVCSLRHYKCHLSTHLYWYCRSSNISF